MAIHIQNNIRTNYEVRNQLHSIPCKIHADCDAPVSKFFIPSINKDGVMKASFRGYPLIGTEVKIPEGYRGVVLHETVRPATETEERKFYIINSFDKFNYWNWGKAASKNDSLIKAMEWIEIAEALHTPIQE
ncbi:hypothetical protein HHI36_022201 [Cryptolaemus montrouzieri]|uniref:Uncharacterized protein n=1 Tax=Cryptolaemus montrouzieri TaxID=559131 RepID=A0ABD2MZ66_9CUCU